MDGEVEMIQCFFNPSHMIFRTRYPYHYKRCSKQHPHIKHKVCPYSALHILKPEDFDAHVSKCDSRPPPTLTASNTVTCKSAPEPTTDSWEEGGETWATEEPVIPHNVQSNTFVYTPLIGGSKAERVQHRLAERRQYCEIENSKISSEAKSNDDEKKKKKKKKKKKSNSNSNSENNNNSANKPIQNNVGNVPLAERKSVTPESLNFDGLSLKE